MIIGRHFVIPHFNFLALVKHNKLIKSQVGNHAGKSYSGLRKSIIIVDGDAVFITAIIARLNTAEGSASCFHLPFFGSFPIRFVFSCKDLMGKGLTLERKLIIRRLKNILATCDALTSHNHLSFSRYGRSS